MENQHQKIKGYRELNQTEIDFMNRIKEFGPQLQTLINDLREHLSEQMNAVCDRDTHLEPGNVRIEPSDEQKLKWEKDGIERNRIRAAEPQRWVSIGATELQQGLMALTRAVAQPTFF